MNKEEHPVVRLARAAVEAYVRQRKTIRPEDISGAMGDRAGVFVSLKKNGQLRGCIGTFEPTQENVAREIVANAISSAIGDPRFQPVRESELDGLEYSVDILTSPEPVDSPAELDPVKYGVIVQSGYRRGLLLPDLEGVTTAEEQIGICRAKAGIGDKEPVKLYRFTVRRYR